MRVIDVAPTICYLTGVPMPGHAEGGDLRGGAGAGPAPAGLSGGGSADPPVAGTAPGGGDSARG